MGDYLDADFGLGLMSLLSGFQQASSMRLEGSLKKKQYEMNARLQTMQAKDAIKRGDKEAKSHLEKVNQMIGEQRASLAAQGIDVDEGSAAAIQAESKYYGNLDITTIKNNAVREAWGYKVKAIDLQLQGGMAQSAANFNASSTLMTGGIQAFKHLSKSSGLKRMGQDMRARAQTTPQSTTMLGARNFDPTRYA